MSQGKTAKPEGKKKRYVKPVVESEEVFETLALACAKCQRGPRGGSQCRAYLRLS